jgi:hypothetical protein
VARQLGSSTARSMARRLDGSRHKK